MASEESKTSGQPKPEDERRWSLVMAEIEAKGTALHAYDRLVWTVRSGFLTVLLGGWAIIGAGLTDPSSEVRWPPLLALMGLSVALAIGAGAMDWHYMIRKRRVRAALDAGLWPLVRYGLSAIDDHPFPGKESWEQFFGITGLHKVWDERHKEHLLKDRIYATALYVLPLLSLGAGLFMLHQGQ